MSASVISENSQRKGNRIPHALQAVFLASNRGKDVHCPPPDQVASRVFVRKPFLQRVTRGERLTTPRKPDNIFQSFRRSLARRDTESTEGSTEFDDFSSSREVEVVCSAMQPTLRVESSLHQDPQQVMELIMKPRGYSAERFFTKGTAYSNRPTPLQIASYDRYLVDLVRENDVHTLREIMKMGISPNPCNSHGESLVHTVCRLGRHEILRMLINDCGTSVRVSDDMGRNPLHDACWTATPCFKVVDLLLKTDINLLFLQDVRGALPLSYVKKENWFAWADFLYSKRDQYWPSRRRWSNEREMASALSLLKGKPNSRSIPDPDNALPDKMIILLVSGRMTPDDIEHLLNPSSDECSTVDEEESDSDDDDDTLVSVDHYELEIAGISRLQHFMDVGARVEL